MNLLFLGGGNMASALIGGLISNDASITTIYVIEPNADQREKLTNQFSGLARQHGITFSVHSEQAQPVSQADIASPEGQLTNNWVILAVKPQHMEAACTQSHHTVQDWIRHANVLSIAAGISTEALAHWCGHQRLVRAMPNTPALVAHGVTGLYAPHTLPTQARAQAQAFMAAVGKTLWVADEPLIDSITALSGSGPAYVFKFIEALAHAGQQVGLSAPDALMLSVETLEGALLLLKSSGESPAHLREKVTSKGGTTAAALQALESREFMQTIEAAIKAARDRGAEMSAQFK